MAIAVISSVPYADGTLLWRVRTVGERSVSLRVNISSHTADLVYQEQTSGITEVLGHPVPLRDLSSPMEMAVLVRTPGYVVFLDGQPMIEVTETRLDTTSSALSMTATGTTGMIALLELRVHEAP
jgi:Flp pilus assembly protein TadG